MLAALFNNIRNVNVVEYDIPGLDSGMLLVQVGACGVCGTDFHIFEGKAPASFPVIPGHEYTGTIVDKASDVKNFSIGDRIAVDPNIHCGYCEHCRTGKVNLCSNLKALGVTLNGGFSDYSVIPASQAYFVPSNIPFETIAFSEPLSCCIHGIDQANIKLGSTVAIVGAGPIGLLMLQLAQLKGAGKIVMIDPLPEKRELASRLSSIHNLDPNAPDFLQEITHLSNGGAEIVIECAGNSSSAETALKIARKGAVIVLFGLADKSSFVNLYLQSFFHRELTIKASLLNPFTFGTAVDLLVSGKIKTDSFKTLALPLVQGAVQDLFTKPRNPSVLKYLIKPNYS